MKEEVFGIHVSCVYQVDKGEPKVMWLSGLHIPESYLTALVQAACRKNGWPLDLSTLYTQVTQHRSEQEVSDRPGQGNEERLTIYSSSCDGLAVSADSYGYRDS